MIDAEALFRLFWEPFRWVFVLMLILGGLKLAFKSRAQGFIGEQSVRRAIGNRHHGALHDVILPDGRGGLTQIDHLLLTPEAILVIETKSYSGRLFGGERESHWTQRFGRRSVRISNPLRQNFGHIQAVRSLVGEGAAVDGRVVVVGPAKFPKGRPPGVLTRAGLGEELAAEAGEPSGALRQAWAVLTANAATNRKSRSRHRAQLAERFGREFHVAAGVALIVAGLALAAWFGIAD